MSLDTSVNVKLKCEKVILVLWGLPSLANEPVHQRGVSGVRRICVRGRAPLGQEVTQGPEERRRDGEGWMGLGGVQGST